MHLSNFENVTVVVTQLVTVLNATELYNLKMVKMKLLCCVYFFTKFFLILLTHLKTLKMFKIKI